MEKKVRQLDDGMRKADRDYHEACQKAEGARQEWETSVLKVGQKAEGARQEWETSVLKVGQKAEGARQDWETTVLKVCQPRGTRPKW